MENLVIRTLQRSIGVIFIFVLAIIIGLNVFFSRGFHSTELLTPSYFNVITLVIALGLFFMIYKMRTNIVEIVSKAPIKIAVISLLLMSLGFQLLVLKFLNVHPSWDFGGIVKNSRILLNGGQLDEYFIKYPNNMFMLCLLTLVGKVISSSLLIYQLVNISIILLSQLLIFWITSKLTGKTVGVLSLGLSVIFFPYIFYAPIVYTDTFSLPFILIPLNILISKEGLFRKDINSLLISSVIFAAGVLLKGSLIIFVIALSIVVVLFYKRWNKVFFIIPFIILFVIQHSFNFFIYENGIMDQQKAERYSFPVTHWIMMAQNKNKFGKYAVDDVILTDKLLRTTSREETERLEIKELKKRLKEKGIIGNLKFNLEKLNHTWTDGTYYSLNKLKRIPVHPENYQRLIDSNSGYLVQGFARIEHILLLLGLLLFAIRTKRKNEIATFYMLSVIGFFFFFLIWEARSRYLVSLTPLLILFSCYGYFGFLSNKKIVINKKNSHTNLEI